MPTLAANTFQPFTLTHLWAVVVSAGIVAGIIIAGRNLRGADSAATPRLRVMERTLGTLALLHWLAYAGHAARFIREDPMFAIPLQMCDIAGLAAALSLLTRWRPLAVLVYFWGLALSSQGYVTPTVRVGPEGINFWFFWGAHLIIVGTAIYECAVRGLVPAGRDLLLALACGLVYFLVTLGINIAFGMNFGYTGPPQADGTRTLADALGSWPLRIVWIALLAIAAMTLAWLPWGLTASGRTRAGGTRGPRGPA
ncbi:MAG: TIGR02206 family membrane protein [Phycisphaerales bacterium]